MSWAAARKVLAAAGEAVTLGETDRVAAGETGTLCDPAAVGDPEAAGDPAEVMAVLAAVELADELQAVTSKTAPASAAHQSTAPAAACRDLRQFVINIGSPSKTSNCGSASHATSTTSAAPPWLDSPGQGVNHGPFGMNITAGTGYAGQRTERTRVIVTPAAMDASPASAKSDG